MGSAPVRRRLIVAAAVVLVGGTVVGGLRAIAASAAAVPAPVGTPSVAVVPGGAQLVFSKSGQGHLVESWYANGWHGPADVTAALAAPSALASEPSAAVTPDGSTQLVFWQGHDNHLHEAWYAAGSWHGALDVSALLSAAAPLGSAPSVTVTPDGTQQLVFWRGADEHLHEAWFASGSWHGPLDITGSSPSHVGRLGSAPAAAVTADGQTQLVFWNAIGPYAGHLVEAWYSDGGWHGPIDITGNAFCCAELLKSGPSVANSRDGTQLVYWEGNAAQLYEAWFAAGEWHGPIDLTNGAFGGAGPLSSRPSAAVTADGTTQLVFWQGSAQSLWEAWYTGSWHGPLDLSAG